MIDLHCHILPGTDDGSKNMEETIMILKKAVDAGFQTICFTPHYVEPEYLNTKSKNKEILNQVKNQLKMENIQLELLLGNEVFINQTIPELLKSGSISTLADSQYVLVEVPMYQEMPSEIIRKILNGITQERFQSCDCSSRAIFLYSKKSK